MSKLSLLRFVLCFTCILISACSGSSSSSVAASSSSSLLRASGIEITDSRSRQVLLRGLNHIALRSDRNHPALCSNGGGNEEDCTTSDAELFELQDLETADFDAIAATGLNALRLVVTWEFAQPDPPPAPYNEAYFRRIDAFIAQARSHGLYVIFDFGQFGWSRAIGGNAGAPAWTVSDTCAGLPQAPGGLPPQASAAVGCASMEFWQNEEVAGRGLQDHYIDLWRFVAARYRDEPAIAMYDLFNEPYGGLLAPGVFEPLYLYPFYRRLASAIREVDARHIVAFQPELYHSIGVPTPFAMPIDIPNSVYIPHEYTAAYFVQRLNPAYTPLQDPITAAYLQMANTEATIFGTPWLIGETGWTRTTNADGVGGPNDATDEAAPRAFARDFTARADAMQLGWLWFAWSSIDAAYGVNFGGELDEELVRTLSRPYPRATAGHVETFSYNPDMHVYQQATSNVFDEWSEIALPMRWQFPQGACVEGDGRFLGRVSPAGLVNAPGAGLRFDVKRQVLMLRPLPETVQITGAEHC